MERRVRLRWIAVALLVEVWCVYQVLAEPLDAWTLVRIGLGHAGASAVFGWGCVPKQATASAMARRVLAGVIALLGFPVFGMVAILAGCLATVFGRQAQHRSVIERELEDGVIVDLAREEHEVNLRAALEVEPLTDLLQGSDPDLKRGAIDALAASQSFRAARVLQSLLHDPDPEIRLYASVRLGSLEDEIGRKIQVACAAADDPRANVSVLEDLAGVYLEYAACGLLDDVTSRHYLTLAEQAYDRAVHLQPGRYELALAIGHVCLRLDQLDNARQFFERAAQCAHSYLDIRLAFMELAYRRGALDELVAHASAALRDIPAQHPDRELVQWWAGAA
jgi:polysaccharide biosynthesis protein PelE